MKWTKDQVLTDMVWRFIKNKVNQINVSLDLHVPLCYLPATCANWWARLNRQWCRSRCWYSSAEAMFSHTIMHPCQTSHFSWDSPIFYHSIPLSSRLNIFLYFSRIFNLAIKKSHWAYFMFSTFTSGKTPVIFYGPNLIIWIITSIYSKVVQLPDLVWNASSSHNRHIQISTHLSSQLGNFTTQWCCWYLHSSDAWMAVISTGAVDNPWVG